MIVCFHVVKLVKAKKIGYAAAIVLTFGLFTFAKGEGLDPKPLVPRSKGSSELAPIQTSTFKQDCAGLMSHPLAEYIGTNLNMEVSYLKDSVGLQTSITQFSYEGHVGGHYWAATSANVGPDNNEETIRYKIDGQLNWNLFGYTFYSEAKHF